MMKLVQRVNPPEGLAAPLLLAAVFVCLQIPDIITYPLVMADEAFYSDAALQLFRHFRFRNDVLSGNLGFDGPYFWQPPGYVLVQSLSYAIAGFGIWQTRLSGILFGGLSCLALYKLVELVGGNRRVALVAGIFPIFWPSFLLTAKSARMDTHAIFFLLLATIFAIKSLTSVASRGYSIAAGACIGLVGMFHSAGFGWALGLVVGLGFETRKTPVNLILLLAAASILPVAWLVVGAFHHDAFAGQFLFHVANRTAQGGVIDRLTSELLRYAGELSRIPLAVALGIFVAIVASRSTLSSRLTRLVATMTIVAVLFNAFFAGKGFGYYQIYTLLCVLVLGAEIWARGFGNLSPSMQRIGVLVIAATFANMALSAYGPRVAALAWQGPERDYWAQLKELTDRLRPDDQVWGNAFAWYATAAVGARLDAAKQPVPVQWTSRPDASRHRFVVLLQGESDMVLDGYTKLGTFGQPLPLVLGSSLTNASYLYDLWISTRLTEKHP